MDTVFLQFPHASAKNHLTVLSSLKKAHHESRWSVSILLIVSLSDLHTLSVMSQISGSVFHGIKPIVLNFIFLVR